jgi:hypothetical protein
MMFEIAEGHDGTAGGPLTKREMSRAWRST